MTNALVVVGVITAIAYGFFVDGTFFKLYFFILAVYTIVS
jgi:hypothetical protein